MLDTSIQWFNSQVSNCHPRWLVTYNYYLIIHHVWATLHKEIWHCLLQSSKKLSLISLPTFISSPHSSQYICISSSSHISLTSMTISMVPTIEAWDHEHCHTLCSIQKHGNINNNNNMKYKSVLIRMNQKAGVTKAKQSKATF